MQKNRVSLFLSPNPERKETSSSMKRYTVVVIRLDCDPQLIVSDYWDDWVEELYVLHSRPVLQVYCTLGRGYFGV